MEELKDLVPDRETFLRVWKRVMPDESLSAVEVAPAEGAPPGQEEKTDLVQSSGMDRGCLEEALAALDEGMALSGELARRLPGGRSLLESLRRHSGQLRAAYFLESGNKWKGNTDAVSAREELSSLLRRQYIWEIRWSNLCRSCGSLLEREDIREIFPELEEASRSRRRVIRRLLSGQ